MTNELITTTDQRVAEFELAQRRAQAFTTSAIMVPEAFRGNLGDCLIAEEMAQRMGASTLMVMQNIHVIHGRPSFSAKFLIACWNASGKYGPIDYNLSGTGDDYGCTASSTRNGTGEVITGPRVTMGMAKAEGWATKNGSKWRTMPDLMLRYRAATMMINTSDPGLSMGMQTTEELVDIGTATEATILPDLPAEVPERQALPAIEPETKPETKPEPGLRGKVSAANGLWYGQITNDEGEIVWADIHGAEYDFAKHGWAATGDLPSYIQSGENEGLFRARRGSVAHTEPVAPEPTGIFDPPAEYDADPLPGDADPVMAGDDEGLIE